jgi:cell division protein FtsW
MIAQATETKRFSLLQHVARFHYDSVLLAVLLFLLAWGTVMIYSTSAVYAEIRYDNSYFFLQRHLMHLVLGIGAMSFCMFLPYRRWRDWLPLLMLGMMVMLVMVLIPGIGHEVKGGRRWLRLSGIGIQPAELLKIVLVIYTASYLERKQAHMQSFARGVAPVVIVTGAYLLLVLLQPDFGTVVLISATMMLMLYVGGMRTWHLAACLTVAGGLGAALVATQAYRMRRILAFLDPWKDPLDSGFQIIQSFIAIGTGGWLGRGLGESRQKLFFLPDAHTDFIFAILSEELGFLWVCLLVLLFALFLWRGYWIAWHAPDTFAKFLAFGCTTVLSLQVIFNLFVVTGLLPTKGLPLPFISAGGSALLMALSGTGILLNISHHIHGPVSNSPRVQRSPLPA